MARRKFRPPDRAAGFHRRLHGAGDGKTENLKEVKIVDELTIRRERTLARTQYSRAADASKTENAGKAAGQSAATKTASSGNGLSVSESMQSLMARMRELSESSRVSYSILQSGEGAAAEIKDTLEKMRDIVDQAIKYPAERETLQGELDTLNAGLDRLLSSTVFSDTEIFYDDTDAAGTYYEDLAQLLDEAIENITGADYSSVAFAALTNSGMSSVAILSSLGLSGTASAYDILEAMAQSGLSAGSTASYVVSLYLGAVIAGDGDASGVTDVAAMLKGLRQLLDRVADGASMDDAISELTGGRFSGMEDLIESFLDGGSDAVEFLAQLLLTSAGTVSLLDAQSMSLMNLLESRETDLMTMLLDVLNGSAGTVPEADSADVEPSDADGEAQDASQLNAARLPYAVETYTIGRTASPGEGQESGAVSVEGGTVTVHGSGDVIINGSGVSAEAIIIEGSGRVLLRNAQAETLIIKSPEAQVASSGENTIEDLVMDKNAAVTFSGRGLLDIGAFAADSTNTVRVAGGAVMVGGGDGRIGENVNVTVEAASSLAVNAGTAVTGADSQAAAPFDVVLRTLVPGFETLTSIAVDGRAAAMALMNNADTQDVARLWLDKPDPSHGYPLHQIRLNGQDSEGKSKIFYVYIQWDEKRGEYRQIPMYPNPFNVTGGTEGEDWEYDDGTGTLRILSPQVTEISGGAGVDANSEPFSGRVQIAGHIGDIRLNINNVSCGVDEGRSFELGRENKVTLILNRGSSNSFRSGSGCAGISVSDGSDVTIESAPVDEDNPELAVGELTVVGGKDGAGIGRDSGGSWDRVSTITIAGGKITSTAMGAGAGIGAGKHGFMGDITITGGTVTAKGGPLGGAGIGGALGAVAGNITISGGLISAEATYHAAAIGAGIQGECGDILITGTTRILKARGGNPGYDIGACIFGGCGKVTVDGADIGAASISLPEQDQITLPAGDGEIISVPRYALSTGSLLLKGLDVRTDSGIVRAKSAISAAQSRVSRILEEYNTLCGKLDKSINTLRTVKSNIAAEGKPVRNRSEADELLDKAKRSILRDSLDALRANSEQVAENVLKLLK